MKTTTRSARALRNLSLLPALTVAAMIAALLVFALPRASADASAPAALDQHAAHSAFPAALGAPAAVPRTTAQLAFHDAMRKLWEDHVTWTRLAIVTFADGSDGFPASATRLLQNQVDIGNAIKPFYGEAAGTQLTALLHDHITIAVELVQAAKAGDSTAFADANTRWYANSDDIADFLAAANPRNWDQDTMRAMMRTHLDQTLAEASHELGGDYAASVADYEQIHAHMLEMADVLSAGIFAQFPKALR
jgi:hypothetical protein